MKILLINLLSIFLISCSSNLEEIERLKAENQQLKSQVEGMLLTSDNFEERIIVVPKSNEITIGEEYEAAVFITFIEKNKPSRLTLYSKDTLTFNSKEVIPTINFKPQDTGHYVLRGTLYQEILGKQYEWDYWAEFDVKEK